MFVPNIAVMSAISLCVSFWFFMFFDLLMRVMQTKF